MPVTRITCPKCGAEGTLSLIQPTYKGPYACWKCHDRFGIVIQDGQLVSTELLSADEIRRIDASRMRRTPPPE